MIEPLPTLPDDLRYVGWHRFPGLYSPWVVSAVHIAPADEDWAPICGRRKTGRGTRWSESYEMAEQARDGSGVCRSCQRRLDVARGQNAGKTTPDPTGSQRGPAE